MTFMNPADAARILAIAAIYDRRTIGETDAQAWADALADLNPRDCADAVRTHYRGSTTWCMPAHIRVIVEGKRRDQARAKANTHTLGELANTRHVTATQQAIDDCKRAYQQALTAAGHQPPEPEPS